MIDLTINSKKTAEKIINFLKKEFKKRKKKKAVLALSGGIDSALCAYLCKKAGLDLHVLILPYKKSGADGLKLAKELKLQNSRIFKMDIGPQTDEAIKQLKGKIEMDNLDRGNIMARQRMILQYAFSRRLQGLVVGTENLSEYYLGYFTLFGDQACDISPISGLWKTQVRQLSEYLGVPKWVLEQEPSAGLWQGQTDEGELGFTYKEADQIMQLALVKKYPKKEIIKKGFDEKTVNMVLRKVKITGYKRQPAPKM